MTPISLHCAPLSLAFCKLQNEASVVPMLHAWRRRSSMHAKLRCDVAAGSTSVLPVQTWCCCCIAEPIEGHAPSDCVMCIQGARQQRCLQLLCLPSICNQGWSQAVCLEYFTQACSKLLTGLCACRRQDCRLHRCRPLHLPAIYCCVEFSAWHPTTLQQGHGCAHLLLLLGWRSCWFLFRLPKVVQRLVQVPASEWGVCIVFVAPGSCDQP